MTTDPTATQFIDGAWVPSGDDQSRDPAPSSTGETATWRVSTRSASRN